MDTIFMNFENSRTCDLHGLLLHLLDKINLKRSNKYITSSNLSIYYPLKNTKNHTRAIHFENQLQRRMKNLNYLMGYILYQVFKNILTMSSKSMEKRLIIL